MANDAEIKAEIDASTGSIGPQGLSMPIIADRSAAALRNFIAGANKNDFHTRNLNWERDARATAIEDIRDVVEGDPSPDGKGKIMFKRGIEVGHIFQLGDKYSKSMNATVLDASGKAVVMQMGCYGMGVTRLVGAIIEQNHDESGIIWPESIAPFSVIVIPINAHKSEQVRATAESLYAELTDQGVEVLFDDREDVRPGAKFADAELMGIPHRVVIGDRGLDKGVVEYVNRREGNNKDLTLDQVRALFL
jgi:prolyl-tRNA synthetase